MSNDDIKKGDLRGALDPRDQLVERAPGEAIVETAIPPLSEDPLIDVDQPTNVHGRTPWEILWLKLKRNRVAMAALVVLIALYAVIPFVGFFAPYSYDRINKDLNFHRPMTSWVRVRDAEGNFRRPFIYGTKVLSMSTREVVEDTSKIYPIRFFVQGDEYKIFWVIPSTTHLFGVEEPARLFLFGSDNFGRDIFSRLLYGSRVSLSVGIVGILISTLIGMLVGGVAGFFGGKTDFILMRIVELILAVPGLYLILVLRQAFGKDINSTYLYFLIIIILSFIGWASTARVIRGMVLSLKEQEYVVAAQALGFSRLWIVIKHILPNTLSFVIVTATLSVPFYILGEVSLSFLGVGIQEPEASWGNMLQIAQNVRNLTDFWWVLAPGVAIFIAVMAWNVFGDGLRDAADPRTQR